MILLTDTLIQIIANFATFDALNSLKASLPRNLKEYVLFEELRRIAEFRLVGFHLERWRKDSNSEILTPKMEWESKARVRWGRGQGDEGQNKS